MRSIYPQDPTPEPPRLAYRAREAATALGMSEKALWDRTSPRGDIPAVKIGSRVLYFVHQIQGWADEELARQQREAGQKAGVEGGSR